MAFPAGPLWVPNGSQPPTRITLELVVEHLEPSPVLGMASWVLVLAVVLLPWVRRRTVSPFILWGLALGPLATAVAVVTQRLLALEDTEDLFYYVDFIAALMMELYPLFLGLVISSLFISTLVAVAGVTTLLVDRDRGVTTGWALLSAAGFVSTAIGWAGIGGWVPGLLILLAGFGLFVSSLRIPTDPSIRQRHLDARAFVWVGSGLLLALVTTFASMLEAVNRWQMPYCGVAPTPVPGWAFLLMVVLSGGAWIGAGWGSGAARSGARAWLKVFASVWLVLPALVMAVLWSQADELWLYHQGFEAAVERRADRLGIEIPDCDGCGTEPLIAGPLTLAQRELAPLPKTCSRALWVDSIVLRSESSRSIGMDFWSFGVVRDQGTLRQFRALAKRPHVGLLVLEGRSSTRFAVVGYSEPNARVFATVPNAEIEATLDQLGRWSQVPRWWVLPAGSSFGDILDLQRRVQIPKMNAVAYDPSFGKEAVIERVESIGERDPEDLRRLLLHMDRRKLGSCLSPNQDVPMAIDLQIDVTDGRGTLRAGTMSAYPAQRSCMQKAVAETDWGKPDGLIRLPWVRGR